MTELLLIGGRSGVGKTSVALAVHEILARDGIRHAIIEGDYLDLAHPAPAPGFAERNLRMLWSAYAAAGYERLVYSQTVSVLQVADIRDAVDPDARVTAALLTATDAEIEGRLRGREPTPESLAVHFERSRRMAPRLDSDSDPHVVRIATDGRSISDVAGAVVALSEWVYRAS